MKAFFFPDPNHEDARYIRRFREALPRLKAAGVTTVYLEFLYEAVPDDKDAFENDFAFCSGGRNGMKDDYRGIVLDAKALGLRVIGLSKPTYYQLSRTKPEAGFAFRTMGPFDGVAARIIQSTCNNTSYVVFLGSGHWLILKHFLPNLELAAELNETEVDPSTDEFKTPVGELSRMIDEAEKISGNYIEDLKKAVGDTYRKVIESVLRYADSDDTLHSLMVKFQDKAGLPITVLQLNYLILMRRTITPPLRLRPTTV